MRQRLRAFFHWQYSQFFIGGLFAAGVGMLTYNHFVAAYVFFSVAGAWAMTYWQVSDHLTKKATCLQKYRNKLERKPDHYRTKTAYRNARRSYWLSNLGGSSALLVLTVLCLIWTHFMETEYELKLPSGSLIPANDPLPPSSCGYVPNDALLIYMGFATSYTTRFPHTIIEVSGRPRLIVDRNPDGSIAISVQIFGSDNKIIAELDRNKFTVNEHTSFKRRRKDRSTLSVIDDYNNEVLSVRYLNPRAIWINGTLRYPGHGPIVFSGSGGGGICTGNAGRSEIAFD